MNKRPEKPEVDPLLIQIVGLMQKDKRTRNAKANVSGLSASTLKNWEEHRVRRPQALSVQMIANALGYRLELVRDRKSR